MKKEKVILKILIENDRIYSEEYNSNQKTKVIVNKTIEHFNLQDGEQRVLRREDGTEIVDYSKTIEEVGLQDGETLRFFIKTKKPDRDKGFA